MPDLVADLKRLASIPSIAFDGFDHGPVHEAYELVVELLRGAGVEQIERLDLPDTSPIITATVPGPPGAPTVLLYAHYDVQPAGPDLTSSGPTRTDGSTRYGRGGRRRSRADRARCPAADRERGHLPRSRCSPRRNTEPWCIADPRHLPAGVAGARRRAWWSRDCAIEPGRRRLSAPTLMRP